MIVQKQFFSKNKQYYAVCNDVTETGKEVEPIKRFSDLSTAVLVLKYIRGDALNQADTETAQNALKEE